MTKDEAYRLAVKKMTINKVGIGHLQAYYQEFLRGAKVTEECFKIIDFTKVEVKKDEQSNIDG